MVDAFCVHDAILVRYMLSSSICCSSITGRCSTETAKHTIMQTMPQNIPGTLVFWCQISWQNLNRVILKGAWYGSWYGSHNQFYPCKNVDLEKFCDGRLRLKSIAVNRAAVVCCGRWASMLLKAFSNEILFIYLSTNWQSVLFSPCAVVEPLFKLWLVQC